MLLEKDDWLVTCECELVLIADNNSQEYHLIGHGDY